MVTKQVRFRDKANDQTLGGILIQSGVVDYIICGCCGGVIETDDPDIEIEEIYRNWSDISECIIGEED